MVDLMPLLYHPASRERDAPDVLRRSDVDAADDVIAEQGAKASADETSRSLHLALPCGIPCSHVKNTPLEFNRRHAIDSRPDSRSPGERHFLGSQRRLPEHGRQRVGYNRLDRDHWL